MKRCPNGTRKNPRTNKCEKINVHKSMKKTKKVKKICPPEKPLYNPQTNRCVKDNALNRKKFKKMENKKLKICPPEKPLYNPQTNRCVTDNALNRNKLNIISAITNKNKRTKKCPREKPLYNPQTNRCIKNTLLNKKKLTKLELDLDKERENILPIAKTITKNKLRNPGIKNKNVILYKNTSCDGPFYSDLNFNKISINNISIDSYQIFYEKENKTKVELKLNKLLGSGSYGSVYKFSDSSNKYNVAVKTFVNSGDDEIGILNKLKSNKVDCNILRCKLLETLVNPIIVCDLYSNSLNNIPLLTSLSNKTKILIVKQLTNELLCLYENGFPYTDIKLDNTLYKCVNKNNFKVVLGDIGSMCESPGIEKGVTTFPPWEYKDIPTYVKCSDKQIVWGIGILFISILFNQAIPFPFVWNSINLFDEKKIKRHILKFVNTSILKSIIIRNSKSKPLITASDLLQSMLELDPKNRISLKELNQLLKKFK
jgi:hypothetical protein